MSDGAVGVIPARFGATRFPGKPLALIAGKPMIRHIVERVKSTSALTDVIVATDDARIVEAVEGFGGRAMMTSLEHRSGTDRVAEVARQVDAAVFLNIQGDEPLVHPEQLGQLAEFLLAHRAVPMATLMTPITREDDIASPHVVKVVTDQDGYALYFSRSPIPFIRPSNDPRPAGPIYWKHLGLYGYQRDFLLRFPHLTPTPLEQAEQLEQLRALEHGFRIKVLPTPHDTIAVDTPEDVAKVEQALARRPAAVRG
jgi:3-deoxy-manno-octulosonate cytidylyltransferase (CMP-KDO synthetase)